MQVLGASWYLASIGRQHSCWKLQCDVEKRGTPACKYEFLDCDSLGHSDRASWVNATAVITKCDAKKDDSDFKFGMFADAFTSEVASSQFIDKYLYCLWWGLRNLRFELSNNKCCAFFIFITAALKHVPGNFLMFVNLLLALTCGLHTSLTFLSSPTWLFNQIMKLFILLLVVLK